MRVPNRENAWLRNRLLYFQRISLTFWEILICILAESESNEKIDIKSISCLCAKCGAGARGQLAWLGVETGSRGRQLAWLCPKLPLCFYIFVLISKL